MIVARAALLWTRANLMPRQILCEIRFKKILKKFGIFLKENSKN